MLVGTNNYFKSKECYYCISCPLFYTDKLRQLIPDKIPPVLPPLRGYGAQEGARPSESPRYIWSKGKPYHGERCLQSNMKHFFYEVKEESLYIEIYCINKSLPHILSNSLSQKEMLQLPQSLWGKKNTQEVLTQ